MLLVLCSRSDRTALAFAKRFEIHDVRLLTCQDVSRSGWKLAVHGDGRSREQVDLAAVVGNERVGVEQINGVITRLGCVGEEELGHIVAGDRSYVAAEMHAFLFAFLHSLPCRIANPPSPACLYGPNLRAIQLRRYAHELGIPVADGTGALASGAITGSPEGDVTVVGERVLGQASEQVMYWSRQFARRCGVPYLRIRFVGHGADVRFFGADVYPRLESEAIGLALVQWLTGEGVAC
jgi:hypothetical protein